HELQHVRHWLVVRDKERHVGGACVGEAREQDGGGHEEGADQCVGAVEALAAGALRVRQLPVAVEVERQPPEGGAGQAVECPVRQGEPRVVRGRRGLPRRGAPVFADGGEADPVGMAREAAEHDARELGGDARPGNLVRGVLPTT
uniref:Uncharacterized protein n=1 Tax=Triticum urartu TaxID=4572 RepID=A0A8R7P5Q8_TRIUA